MHPNQISAKRTFKLPHEKKVFVATPAYKSIYTSTYVVSLFSLINEAQKKRVGLTFSEIDTADIVMSRNYLVSLFYFNFPDSTHLLFLDSDMGYSPSLIMQMLELDANVSGVIYPKRVVNLEKLHANGSRPFLEAYANACEFVGQTDVHKKIVLDVNVAGKEFKHTQIHSANPKRSFINAKKVGTGILLIKREAITKMIEQCPDISKAKKPRGLKGGLFEKLRGYITPFNKIIVNDYELSEDYSFCHRWTEQCGGIIMANISSPIKHVGEITVETKFSDTWETQVP